MLNEHVWVTITAHGGDVYLRKGGSWASPHLQDLHLLPPGLQLSCSSFAFQVQPQGSKPQSPTARPLLAELARASIHI